MKNCIFCGSNNVEVKTLYHVGCAWVMCNSCLAEGPIDLTPKLAEAKWDKAHEHAKNKEINK